MLSPIGFDSFGLPAENAAIQTGTHPRIHTDANVEALSDSLRRIGAVYDWRRAVKSHDPTYIRWTQWIFLKFYEAGLVYRDNAPVNWCPGCQTVLANEQVLGDGTCERSGDPLSSETWSSGSTGLPPTPSNSLTIWTTSTGPRRSKSCSATGSDGRREPSLAYLYPTPTDQPERMWRPWPSSRLDPTRRSA
ncbi:MAG: hypothetical protein Ct9H300mP12_00600 [Acidimicrobiales bacterium]|nr:MAG: hypothetical protein Ct9H300mP12_00600 [Acidimicrobiales bacterium]